MDCITECQAKGVLKIISTDISRDGMLTGTAFELNAEIPQNYIEKYQYIMLYPILLYDLKLAWFLPMVFQDPDDDGRKYLHNLAPFF